MTKDQLSFYRGLWAAACRAQGWDVGDETLRRQVRLEAVGQESTRTLNENQVTHLYNHLRFLARPESLAAAMADAGPAAAAEQNRRRQHLHVIGTLGFADAYIARCARGACRKERATDWRALSVAALFNLRRTLTSRGRERDHRAGLRGPINHPRDFVPYHQRDNVRRRQAAARQVAVSPRLGVVDDDQLF